MSLFQKTSDFSRNSFKSSTPLKQSQIKSMPTIDKWEGPTRRELEIWYQELEAIRRELGKNCPDEIYDIRDNIYNFLY